MYCQPTFPSDWSNFPPLAMYESEVSLRPCLWFLISPPLSLNLVLLPLKCWYPITGWKFRKQFWDVRCLILFFSQRERRELVECIWFSCTLKDWEKDNTLLGWSVEESWYLYQISVCDIIWLSIFAITELHFAVLVWDILVHRKTLYYIFVF